MIHQAPVGYDTKYRSVQSPLDCPVPESEKASKSVRHPPGSMNPHSGLLCINLSALHSNAFGLLASSVYYLDFGLFGLL